MSLINYKATFYATLLEVATTHPLDAMKTKIQMNQKIIPTEIYKGVGSRLFGTFPMRIAYWNTTNYCKEYQISPLLGGLLIASFQTAFDYPIEVVKTQKIVNNRQWHKAFHKLDNSKAFIIHWNRNFIFASSVCYFINNDKDKSNYKAGIGGILGSVITQPLDTLKTWYQSENKKFPKHWTIKDYLKGFGFRAGISFMGMNIGWISYKYFV